IRKFEEYVFDLEESLPEIYEVLEESLSDAQRAQEIVSKGEDELGEAGKIVASGMNTVDQAIAYMDDAESRIHQLGPKVNENIDRVEEALEDVVGVLGDIESIDLDPLAELKDVEKLQEQIKESIAYIDTIIDALQSVVNE